MPEQPPTFRRSPARGLKRFFFKSPVLAYVGPIAAILGWRHVLMLTTIGRTSGQPRTTGVSFMPVENHYVIFSGWGVTSNWYRNILANPEVTIRIGSRRTRATATLVPEPERRKELMLRMRDYSVNSGPPVLLRPLFKLTGLFDYDAEIALAVAQGEKLPVIEVRPHA
jgi:deazaflavin-dependent oxidoreductase (nitroreductase family)